MTLRPAPIRRRVLLAAAGAAASLAAPATRAQPLSDRPIRILVGAPAGGTADLIGRTVAEPMAKRLGQPVIVDNRPGGLGAIVMDAFLGAPRDGHTLLLSVNGLFTEIPHTMKPKYDPVKDVRPLAELGHPSMTRTAWLGLFTTPDAPVAAQQRLREEALAALALPAVRERLASLGLEVNTANPPTPEQMARSIEADHRSIGEALRAVGYQPGQG